MFHLQTDLKKRCWPIQKSGRKNCGRSVIKAGRFRFSTGLPLYGSVSLVARLAGSPFFSFLFCIRLGWAFFFNLPCKRSSKTPAATLLHSNGCTCRQARRREIARASKKTFRQTRRFVGAFTRYSSATKKLIFAEEKPRIKFPYVILVDQTLLHKQRRRIYFFDDYKNGMQISFRCNFFNKLNSFCFSFFGREFSVSFISV